MVSTKHAERAEKFLTFLKATTKAPRHEERRGTLRVFLSSWFHFSVSSASSALDVVAAYATMPPVP